MHKGSIYPACVRARDTKTVGCFHRRCVDARVSRTSLSFAERAHKCGQPCRNIVPPANNSNINRWIGYLEDDEDRCVYRFGTRVGEEFLNCIVVANFVQKIIFIKLISHKMIRVIEYLSLEILFDRRSNDLSRAHF